MYRMLLSTLLLFPILALSGPPIGVSQSPPKEVVQKAPAKKSPVKRKPRPKIADPLLVTFAPDKPKEGDLIILTCNAQNQSSIIWILGNSDKTFLPVNDNTQCVFSSGDRGQYRFFAVVADRTGKQTKASIVVPIGNPDPDPPGPGPDPDPDPDPDVPDDEFNNLGKQVATWSQGLPKRKEVAKCFSDASTGLREGKYLSIQDAAEKLIANRTSILGNDVQYWTEFFQRLNNDFNNRWPLDRGTVADYWNVIASGLGGDSNG